MLRPVVAVADARRVAGARQAVTRLVDAPAVFARRDGWVTGWNDEGQAAGLKASAPPTTARCRRCSSATPGRAVGLTADKAERAGHRIRVIDVDLGQTVPGAGLYADGYTGRARMVIDEDHGYLLGVTFVGPGEEELIYSATIAVAGQVPISRLWHAVSCFPSISEVWLRLLEAYRN